MSVKVFGKGVVSNFASDLGVSSFFGLKNGTDEAIDEVVQKKSPFGAICASVS